MSARPSNLFLNNWPTFEEAEITPRLPCPSQLASSQQPVPVPASVCASAKRGKLAVFEVTLLFLLISPPRKMKRTGRPSFIMQLP
jgi:hypothetical protein